MTAQPEYEKLTDEQRGLWACPDCAFAFAAEHIDIDGGYSCPCCAERRLKNTVDRLVAVLVPSGAEPPTWLSALLGVDDEETNQ